MTTTAPPADTGRRDEFADQRDLVGSVYPPGLSFKFPGDTFTLAVAGFGKERDRDYDTGDPLSWEDGSPKMVHVIHGPCDGGQPRAWWIRGKNATTAVREALKAAGVHGFAPGDLVQITRGKDELVPPKNPNKPGKELWANTYEVVLTPAGA